MQLTDHFSLEELVASETAARKGIDNTLPAALMPNLRALAQGLELVRAIDAAGIEVAQIIHEFGHWCHVSFAAPDTRVRKELLTIASAAEGYRPGLNPIA